MHKEARASKRLWQTMLLAAGLENSVFGTLGLCCFIFDFGLVVRMEFNRWLTHLPLCPTPRNDPHASDSTDMLMKPRSPWYII